MLEARTLLAANPIAWWRMQEATSGPATAFENEVISAPDRNLSDVVSSPQYANSSLPNAPSGDVVAGNTAYASFSGNQGMFDQEPGFLDDQTFTWEGFYRRANANVAANFFGNDNANHVHGISRVGVNADGDVVLQLTGNNVGNTGNSTESFTFSAPDDADWHHFAFTYNNGTLTGYVDYQQISSHTPQFYNGRVFSDFQFLTMGFANELGDATLSPFWFGELDEIRVSDDVLPISDFLGAAAGLGGSEVSWWRMQESTSGTVAFPPGLTDTVGSRDLTNNLSSPSYSTANMPVTPDGVGVTGNTAYTTGYAGGQGAFRLSPGFLDDTSYTWEAFYRRASANTSANFYGNDTGANFSGVSRVGVNADGDVVLLLTGNDVGTSGNTTEEFVFAGADDDQWHHFAFTFDSGTLRGYVDYQLVNTFSPQFYTSGRIFTDFAFLTVGFANETSNPSLSSYWSGDFDEIRISSDVLAPSEFLGFDSSANVVATLIENEYAVNVNDRGTIEVVVGDNEYTVESSFSFPGPSIGYHSLSEFDTGSWALQVEQLSASQARITGSGDFYTLVRTINTSPTHIDIDDVLTNTSGQNVGVIVSHQLTSENGPSQLLLSGISQSSQASPTNNPTIYMADSDSRLGFVAEDTISRLQFQAFANGNEGRFQMNNFALAVGATQTLEFGLYPLDAMSDYWTFINRVRDDWGVNHTVEAFEFGPTKSKWDTPGALEPYLDRKHIVLGEATGFLDYDNFWIATRLDVAQQRNEYKLNAQAALAAIRAVDPNLKVLGAMEGPFHSLTQGQSQQLFNLLPPAEQVAGFPKEMAQAQYNLLLTYSLPIMDSVPLSPSGRPWYELYFRNDNWLIALLAYPQGANSKAAEWTDQATFLLDEVGLDGIYIDGGGPVNAVPTVDQGWDGISVDINLTTGQITNQFTDFRYVIGTNAFIDLHNLVQTREKTLVANGYAYTQEMQSLPVMRFMETGGLYDPLTITTGQKPPLIADFYNGHLGIPTALANIPSLYGAGAINNYAEFVMKDLITHLRHGLLYTYFNTEIPQFGSGNGSYDAINAMFPITPVELNEGWIVGQERTVSALSGTYQWNDSQQPQVQCFGLDARESTCSALTLTDQEGSWTVELTLQDWAEIVVIQAVPPVTWVNPANGEWDTDNNWSSGNTPQATDDVEINPSTDVTVTGPAASTTVDSLQIGAGNGNAEVELQSGNTLTTNNGTTIETNGTLSGDGTIQGNVVLNGGTLSPGSSTVQSLTSGDPVPPPAGLAGPQVGAAADVAINRDGQPRNESSVPEPTADTSDGVPSRNILDFAVRRERAKMVRIASLQQRLQRCERRLEMLVNRHREDDQTRLTLRQQEMLARLRRRIDLTAERMRRFRLRLHGEVIVDMKGLPWSRTMIGQSRFFVF